MSATVEAAAVSTPASIAMSRISMVAIPAIAIAMPVSIATAITVGAAITISIAATVVAIPTVIPRPRSNKDSAAEPRRTIVSIGRTSIRSISVIPVRACRRTVHIRAYTHANRDLRMRVSSRDEKNRKQSDISKNFHYSSSPESGFSPAFAAPGTSLRARFNQTRIHPPSCYPDVFAPPKAWPFRSRGLDPIDRLNTADALAKAPPAPGPALRSR